MEAVWKFTLIGTGGAIGFLFGGWSIMLSTLFVFMFIDQVSGLLASRSEGVLSSKIGFRGIAKKVVILSIIVVAHMLDLVLAESGVITGHIIREGAIFFYIGNELLSIIENSGRMGVPLPPQVTNAVAVLKGKGDGK